MTEKKSLRRFLFKLTIIIFLIFICDRGIGFWIERNYFAMKHGSFFKTLYGVEYCDENVLIMGSSRAYSGYDPEMIGKKLGMSCYNIGKDGAGILYQYAVYNCIRKRHKPKIIILDLAHDFTPSKLYYDRLSVLLPHYYEQNEIREIVNLKSNYEPVKTWSKLYRYNSMLAPVLISNYLEKNNEKFGYLPLYRRWEQPLHADLDNASFPVDSLLIHYYKKLLCQMKADSVKIWVVASPIYVKTPLALETYNLAKGINESLNIPLWNYLEDTSFQNHRSLFADPMHLNDSGVKVFTQLVCDRLQE